MIALTLYYVTNRNHIGQRWAPDSYGQNFSADRADNLRFGKITLDVNANEVARLLTRKVNGRNGDGEALSSYICKKLQKSSSITAFKEQTTNINTPPASVIAFNELKCQMETKRDIVVYIHGFNVDWLEAVSSAMALELMLNRNSSSNSDIKGTSVFLFSWPSNGNMIKNKAYASDRSDARDSAAAFARGLLKLRDFLTTLRPESADPAIKECRQQLHLLCHSMGNYVLQKTLKALAKYNSQPHIPRLFHHIFMCAPDVDDNIFELGQPMENLHRLSRQITIYYNNGDLAMYISDYTKGNADRLGHNGAARPLQLHNKISQVDCSNIVGGITEHSYYLWATVNEDIRHSIDEVRADDPTRNREQRSSQVWKLI